MLTGLARDPSPITLALTFIPVMVMITMRGGQNGCDRTVEVGVVEQYIGTVPYMKTVQLSDGDVKLSLSKHCRQSAQIYFSDHQKNLQQHNMNWNWTIYNISRIDPAHFITA